MLVNTGLGFCAFVIGLYLTFYILQIFRLRIGRIQAEIKSVQQSIEQGEPISSPVFHQPQHQDELTELEHDLKMMVQRLSVEISNRQEIEQQLLVLATRDKLTGALTVTNGMSSCRWSLVWLSVAAFSVLFCWMSISLKSKRPVWSPYG